MFKVSETGVYSIGDISFGIDAKSLNNTIQLVRNLPRPTLETFVSLHGVSIHERLEDRPLNDMAASLIQNDWYSHYKGEIPMSVKKGHEKREKNLEKANEEAQTEPKERKMKVYALAEGINVTSFRGQKAEVIAALKEIGSGTVKEIAAAAQFSAPSRQSPERVVGFYMGQMKKKVEVTEVEEGEGGAISAERPKGRSASVRQDATARGSTWPASPPRLCCSLLPLGLDVPTRPHGLRHPRRGLWPGSTAC